MKFLPANALEVLEHGKILEGIASLCYGQEGKEVCRQLAPRTQLREIREELQLVLEARQLMDEGIQFPMRNYPALTTSFQHLSVNDFVLPLDELQMLRNIFILSGEITGYWTEILASRFSALHAFCLQLPPTEEWLDLMQEVLDDDGSIRPDASGELLQIAGKLHKKRKELDREFHRLTQQYRKAGFLAGNVESIRNGRRVFSIPSEHKRKIRGIIHDASSSGKTSFIEPEEIILINNDIFELEGDYQQEVIRILRKLCNSLRPDLSLMRITAELIARLDSLLARGSFARKIKGELPELQEEPIFHILRARHPILIQRLQAENREVVPFDFIPESGERMLILSGPNAGGKTVLMKTIGLLQMMLQSGILIPVAPESRFGIFSKLFVEIGDQQSLEDDLSTYSSHLGHMRDFLEHADEQSLILIDEFGSGTDPRIGGALAEAVLQEFTQKKAYGVITTHYGNLKAFAFKTDGVINGAMIFDQEKMTPIYAFQPGRPGSSFAFEIAAQTGMPQRIMDYAKNKAGRNQKALEDLLAELQEEKARLESGNQQLIAREKQLGQLINNYESLKKDLDISKKRWKLERKEEKSARLSNLERELIDAIKKVKVEKNLEAAEQKKKEIERRKEDAKKRLAALREEVFTRELEEFDITQLQEGAHVRLRNSDTTGQIIRIDGDEAMVVTGVIKMTVPLIELRPVKTPIERAKGLSVNKALSQRGQEFKTTIDIRGMKPETAIPVLQKFFDEALMAEAYRVTVIHGKGKGMLRQIVQNKLREYPVKSKGHLPAEQGGEGVTVVEFE